MATLGASRDVAVCRQDKRVDSALAARRRRRHARRGTGWTRRLIDVVPHDWTGQERGLRGAHLAQRPVDVETCQHQERQHKSEAEADGERELKAAVYATSRRRRGGRYARGDDIQPTNRGRDGSRVGQGSGCSRIFSCGEVCGGENDDGARREVSGVTNSPALAKAPADACSARACCSLATEGSKQPTPAVALPWQTVSAMMLLNGSCSTVASSAINTRIDAGSRNALMLPIAVTRTMYARVGSDGGDVVGGGRVGGARGVEGRGGGRRGSGLGGGELGGTGVKSSPLLTSPLLTSPLP